MMLVDPLQVGPRPTTICGWRGAFPARADRVAASWVHRQPGFQAQLTFPVIDDIVDVAEALPSMEAQRHERHVARRTIEAGTADTRAAVFLAVDTEVVQMHVAPPEHDL